MLVRVMAPVAFMVGLGFSQTYDLPILFVNTQNNKCLDMNVTEKIPATMRVLDGATNNVADSAKGTLYNIGIKVRGQSSATFPKPGYTIEIRDDKGESKDVSMFGLPPSDDWILHGPYVDKSLIRNALAHWMFRQAGRYSPRTKHFDLYINGQYRGVYALVEKIKRGKYRVNVSKLKETDLAGDSLTGGYIWAFDKTGTNTGGAGNNNQGGIDAEGFKTNGGVNVIMHYPKKDKDPQKNSPSRSFRYFFRYSSCCFWSLFLKVCSATARTVVDTKTTWTSARQWTTCCIRKPSTTRTPTGAVSSCSSPRTARAAR